MISRLLYSLQFIQHLFFELKKRPFSFLQIFTWLFIFFLFSLSNITAQNGWFEEPLSQRIANYKMQITLDPEEKTIDGKTTLTWKNPSNDTVPDLHFHLYYNAFKNTESTFFSNSNRLGRRPDSDECLWGSNEMKNIKDEEGRSLISEYIQPNDGNEADQTVLRVELAEPVLPGESVTVTFDFMVKIPKIMVRTGYSRDYFFLAQWYPKVGVYETEQIGKIGQSGWNCHQYHSNTEYYGEFGNYDVDITVPSNYKVGASGSIQKVTEKGEMTTHSYHLEDVIDYSWTASPEYLIYEDKWRHVDLKVMTFPGHECYVERYFNAAKNSFEYFAEHLGEYPYHSLTMVDVPYHGLFTGAMEYPTFISVLNLRFFPEGVLFSETFTVHELTHQFFQQILATNEQEEPWIDEGFTTYWEGRIMNHFYGDKKSAFEVLGIGAGNVEYNRIEYFNMDHPRMTSTSNTGFDNGINNYRTITYNKTAIWLRTLEGIVGQETMDKIWKTFYEKWKFNHPYGRDFIEVVNEVTSENMDWFFKSVHFGTGLCDYELASISNNEILPKAGIFGDECLTGNEEGDSKEETLYKSQVTLYRNGQIEMPVEVLVHFEDGTEIVEKWDGKARIHYLNFTKPTKVQWADIDPERKIHIDQNFTNNSLTLEPETTPIKKYFSKFLFWVQNVMQTITMLV